jgi:hypothetical protein
LCAVFAARKEGPQKEGKKRITMVTEVLLTGLVMLLVLAFLVALVYSMAHLRADARTQVALDKDTPGQQRVFSASILNFLNQK